MFWLVINHKKKLITNTKISCSLFDIRKLKVTIVVLHFAKVNKTHNCLIFLLTW